MTKPGLSLLAVLLDRSSSARPVADAIRSGVDALLADQRERPGELLVTLAACGGGGQQSACAQRPVADVAPVALKPRGRSALHEGIVTLIDDVGAGLAGLEESERPERVVLAVVGDTAADTGDTERVRKLVERQRRDYAWEFVLVDVSSTPRPAGTASTAATGAPGTDEVHNDGVPGEAGVPAEGEWSDVLTAVAIAEARLGVPATAAILAGPGSDGVRAGLAAASAFVSRARASRPWEPVEGFTDDERAAASAPAPARRAWWRRLLGATA
ncbi:hypothetical protein [Pseudonocardia sp. KRD291]|uniref:hypothetical protein n=1 Tax=Pseudonocardia sp. KRD291 TaxID=2792007 RepID=UPI001C4A59E5|nr:hypothetical protein [Pseudonocardia sp. KRD291]MBW0101493.1 hypothetical protein [Pseudonocardia sp. KRD291]